MESLLNQMRRRYSGAGQENKEETSSSRERRVPPEKTRSFKGEKKKSQNWFGRQFSRQMSLDYDPSDSEYPTAVAAAAFAVKSIEESSILDQKKTREIPDTTSTKIKSQTEDTITLVSEPRTVSRKTSDKRVTISEATDEKMPEKAVSRTPSIKKTPTSADEQLKRTASTKPERPMPKPNLPSAFPPTEVRRPIKPEIGDSKADAWEKAEMDKIKERYEKQGTTILSWQTNKKKKAKNKVNKNEAELDKRRARLLQHYRSEIERIDQIAGGARAKAEENRRNEEFKVKEKANRIRSTGKLPPTCFCF